MNRTPLHSSRMVRCIFASAALCSVASTAFARSITGVSYTQASNGEKRINVAFEAGAAGDDHALYLAFDTADKGEDMASWATFQRVGRVASGDTAASAVVSSLAAGAYTHCRAFLVENRLPYDTLVESLRQTGTQWFDTGMKPNYRTWCRVAVQFDSNETRQQRAFGITSDGNDAAGFSFSLYINGSGYWSSACQDGRGNWAWGGWSIATTQRAMLTLDANNGSSQGYYFSITNLTTHGNTRYTHQTTRTAESAGTLVVLANRAFAADGTDSITGIMTGGYIDYCQIRDGGENGTPIRDFRPCSVNGRGAMYDAVNGTITYSGGADPFKTDGEALAAAPASGETKLSVSAAVALASPASVGRAITAADYRRAGSVTNIVLSLASGATGADHALYLAWDTTDKGADMANWSHFQRVGRVPADATTVAAPVSTNLATEGRTICRAFLVENALPYDSLVEHTKSTGSQWMDTGVYPDPQTIVTLTAKLDEVATRQQTLFGISSSDGTSLLTFDLYVQGSGYWAANCRDGSGEWQTANTGWSASAAGFVTHTLDAYTGNYTFKQLFNGNGKTKNSQASHSRTATAAATLPIFARKNFVGGSYTIPSENTVRGGLIDSLQISHRRGLIRNFLPCSQNGAGAMYDAVEGVVYHSASSADFDIGGECLDCTPTVAETMVAVSGVVDLMIPHGTVLTIR